VIQDAREVLTEKQVDTITATRADRLEAVDEFFSKLLDECDRSRFSSWLKTVTLRIGYQSWFWKQRDRNYS